MKTSQFTLTMGVNPGYHHDNKIGLDAVAPVWHEEADRVYADTQIYVSASVTPGVTVYHPDWGCPVGGEKTVVISGIRNPHYCEDDFEWRNAVRRVVLESAKRFSQETVYLAFHDIDFEYLR
jgi:hypothetical protein